MYVEESGKRWGRRRTLVGLLMDYHYKYRRTEVPTNQAETLQVEKAIASKNAHPHRSRDPVTNVTLATFVHAAVV